MSVKFICCDYLQEYVVYLEDFNVDKFLHNPNQNVQVPQEKLALDADVRSDELLLGRQLPDTRSTM